MKPAHIAAVERAIRQFEAAVAPLRRLRAVARPRYRPIIVEERHTGWAKRGGRRVLARLERRAERGAAGRADTIGEEREGVQRRTAVGARRERGGERGGTRIADGVTAQPQRLQVLWPVPTRGPS